MRVLIALLFNLGVAVGIYLLGASVATAWFTFLGLTIVAGLGDNDIRLQERLDEIENKLNALLVEREQVTQNEE